MAVHYDELWKNIIEKLFPHFLSYFMPELYADVDLVQGYCAQHSLYSQLSRKGITTQRKSFRSYLSGSTI